MANLNSGTTAWLRGRVKAVPSGDCIVIMAIGNTDLPLEKTITLASIMAPKLVGLHRHHKINICMLHIMTPQVHTLMFSDRASALNYRGICKIYYCCVTTCCIAYIKLLALACLYIYVHLLC